MNPTNFRASIVTGCVVAHDAISNIVRQQADALSRPTTLGASRGDVRIFTQGTNLVDARIVEMGRPAELLAHPHFATSDLIVFHYGIRYDLFDALLSAPRNSRVLAYYHGVTPPNLCRGADRATTADSYRQANLLLAADKVLVTSPHLERELLSYGLTADRLVRVPPAVALQPAIRRGIADSDTVRFLYVGRFVASKGVTDLLEAFRQVRASGANVTLALAGSRTFSDAAYLATVQEAAKSLGTAVEFHFDKPAAELAQLFANSDVFVLPSYHEGFGVPIVEALAAGCYVICTTAGASADTAGGLGRTFTAGVIPELVSCLNDTIAAWDAGQRPTATGTLTPRVWAQRAAAYAETFSLKSHENRFRTAAFEGLRILPASLRQHFAGIQARVQNSPAVDCPTPAVFKGFWSQFQSHQT
ncbi:MAG: glycosyltransferase family 4 protein, partial [Gemmataceae bacterium]